MKRKPSDKRSAPPKVTETKDTTPLSAVPSHSVTWRTPLETIYSPIEKSPPAFQQFLSEEDPEAPSSNKTEMKAEERPTVIITPPTPKLMDPQATPLESHSSLSSPLVPSSISQQHSSSLAESVGPLSPQEKSARGSSFSSLQTKVTTTPPEPSQRSLDRSPNLDLSNSSYERLRSTASVSPRIPVLSFISAMLCQ